MEVDFPCALLKYLSNELIWEFKWEWKSIAMQSNAIPCLLLLGLRKTKYEVHRNIYLFVMAVLLGEHISSDIDWELILSSKTNSPWYHLLTPLYFFVLYRFFDKYLFAEKVDIGRWLPPLAFAFLAVWNATLGDGFYNFPKVTAGLYSVAGILLPLSYFYRVLQELKIERIELDPMFWVCTGMILYFSGNFLLWCGLNLLTFDYAFFNSVYSINRGLTIFLNFCFVIAILLNPPLKINTSLTTTMT